MAIPGWQDFMLPILKVAGDKKEHTVLNTIETVASQLGISEEEKRIMQPRGGKTQYSNRARWALTYLTKSVLVQKTERGKFKITPRGLGVLKSKPPRIDHRFLRKYPEFQSFIAKPRGTLGDKQTVSTSEALEDVNATPDERLDEAYTEIRATLADDLLERVRGSSDKFFEYLVVNLLTAMGYGGSHSGSGQVVGRSGDGGVDGLIQADRLGLDAVYVQAKRWQNSVGPNEIREFAGSLAEKKAHKGVFITSGVFTDGARQAAERASAKVVLIDGEHLAQLMIDYGVGVADHKTYQIKKVDSDYFDNP